MRRFVLLIIAGLAVALACPEAKSCCPEAKHGEEERRTLPFLSCFCPACPAKRGERPHLGVYLEDSEKGVLIKGLVEDGPAEEADIKVGDIILAIDGTEVKDAAAVREIVVSKKVGDEVTLKLLRNGEEKEVKVKLGKAKRPKLKAEARMELKEKGGGFGGFGPTTVIFDFDTLNSLLRINKFQSELSPNHFTFGGGGWAEVGSVTIGGYGFGGSQTVASDSLVMDVNFGAGFFEAGFIPFSRKFLTTRLLLGIGGGGFTMALRPRESPPTRFDSLLKYPNFGSKISASGIALAPALALDIPISFVGLSLKAGYIYFPVKPAWKYDNGRDLNIGPKLTPDGPYLQLLIIFGGRKDRH